MTSVDPQTPDSKLIMQASGRDQAACTALVERYFGMVWAIAYSRLKDRHSAEDLAQEVFLVAFLHLDRLGETDHFSGWLSRIARNRAIDWLRIGQRSSRLVAMVPVEHISGLETGDGEAAMERDERDQQIRDAIFTLPQDQREIVLMHFAQGMSQKQIADRLEMHPGTISRQLSKALASLQTPLQELIERSSRALGAPRNAVTGASAVVAGLATMSASSRTTLLSAAEQSSGIVTATLTGGGVKALLAATLAKIVGAAALIAVVVGATGYALHLQSPAATTSPNAPPPTVQSTSDATLLQARNECYPPKVCEYLAKNTKDLAKKLDPTGQTDVMMETNAIDHHGTIWIGTVMPAGLVLKAASDMQDSGMRTLDLGNTDLAGLTALFSDTGIMLPVIQTQNTPTGPGHNRMSVSLDPTTIDSVMGAENFCLISQASTITPQNDDGYHLHLSNYPAVKCIQQLILIVPNGWHVRKTSQPPASTHPIDDFVIDLWQARLTADQTFSVNVVLDRTPAP